jgi:hypothetical protein
MKLGLREKEVVTGLAAGATAFVVIKKGLAASIPAVGPVSQPLMLILVGIAISSFVDGGGIGGDVVTGVGYGLICAGAAAL